MRIRVTAVTSVSDGAGRRYSSGWEGPVPAELGRSWVAAGHAVQLDGEDSEKPQEREAPKPPRKATKRAPRKASQ